MNEQYLFFLIQHTPAAIALLDRELRFIARSQRWLRDFKLNDEILGLNFYDVFPEISDHWREVHRRALSGDTITSMEDPFWRANGVVQWLRWQVTPWYKTETEIGGIVIFTEDITERKQLDEQIQKLGRFQKSILDAIGDPICVIDENGDIVTVNRAWRQFAEHNIANDAALCIGANYLNLCDRAAAGGDRTAKNMAEAIRAIAAGASSQFSFEYPFDAPSGEKNWIMTRVSRYCDEAPARIVISYTNITNNKRAELEILAGRLRLEAALNSMSDVVFITDTKGNLVEFNQAFATFYKFKDKNDCPKTLEEYTNIIDVFRADGQPVPLEQWAVPRALRGESGAGEIFTVRFRRTGETLTGGFSFAPILNEHGVITGMVMTGRDITAQRQMEMELRASEQRLSGLIRTAMDGIISIDEQHRICLINPAAQAMFGLDENEALGQPIDRLIPNSVRDRHTELIRQFAETGETSRRMGKPSVITGMRANGEEFPLEATISQTITPAGKQFTVIHRDVTERERLAEAQKQAKRKIKEQKLKLEEASRHFIAHQTATAIAHEINQPLAAIASYVTGTLRILDNGGEDKETLKYALNKIEEQTQRAGKTIH